MAKLETTASKVPMAGKGTVEVVRENRDRRIAGKSFSCGIDHGGREVDRQRRGMRMIQLYQRKQAAAPGSEIENALYRRRNYFQQNGFAFDPVRNRVCTAQIIKGVFR